MLSSSQRETCLAVLRNADELRRARGAALTRCGCRVTRRPGERNILACLTYEYFSLDTRGFTEHGHNLVLMSDGTAACDCPDSVSRRTICKHAVCAATILLAEEQS